MFLILFALLLSFGLRDIRDTNDKEWLQDEPQHQLDYQSL
jgi:hypothetical protein